MKVKKFITVMAGFMVLLVLTVIFITHEPSYAKVTNAQKAEAVVSVTNFAKTSGGSGVILRSGPMGSTVLTNSHVCKLIEVGGLVNTDVGSSHIIAGYQHSTLHDLCIIYVTNNLGVNTDVSRHATLPQEPAVIVGHPDLLPTMVVGGYFSSNLLVHVRVGTRPCTEKDIIDLQTAFQCLFEGVPIIKDYEAQVVSGTIEAGSSGSPIFNSSGEMAALVFAGAGGAGLSYAYAVPLTYIRRFLFSEVNPSRMLQPQKQGGE